jgi:hypothetical protein
VVWERSRVGGSGRALPAAPSRASGRRCPSPPPTLGFLPAREPIFSQTHTNEFCGIEQSTPEPAGSWAPLRPGRWVYEGGEGRAARGCKKTVMAGFGSRLGCGATPRSQLWFFCQLASPFLAKPIQMSFAGLRNPPQSPPARGRHCAPVGGYMRERKTKPLWGGCRVASAPLHGSLRRPLLVPFHTSPLSRGALRSAGVPTISASTTPAPLLPWPSGPGMARHLGRLRLAQGNTPCAPRGGLCGCLADGQTST